MTLQKPTFDQNSTGSFKDNTSIYSVLFGTNGVLLENELNELQWLQISRKADIMRGIYTSGLLDDVSVDIDTTNNVVTIGKSNQSAINMLLDGYLFAISGKIDKKIRINYSTSDFDNNKNLVFLEAWFEVVGEDGYNKVGVDGSTDSSYTTDYTIKDPRVGVETTRRIQMKWKVGVLKNKATFDTTTLSVLTNQPYSSITNDKIYVSHKDVNNKNILETSYVYPIVVIDKTSTPTVTNLMEKSKNKISGRFEKKEAVSAATTASISLFGSTQNIDGFPLTENQRVLVKDQTNEKDNGIYIVKSGNWILADDSTTTNLVYGNFVEVEDGSDNAGTSWVYTVSGTKNKWEKFGEKFLLDNSLTIEKSGSTINVKLASDSGLQKYSSGATTSENGLKVDFGTGTNQVSRGDHNHTTGDITNIDINSSTLSNGQVLKYNSTTSKWENSTNSTVEIMPLADLSDVTLSSPSDGQTLVYNSGVWINSTVSGGGGATNLDGLSDVVIGTGTDAPSNGQVLMYDTTGTASWKNKPLGSSATLNTGDTPGTVATGDHTHAVAIPNGATGAKDGFMSKEDKQKLDGIATGANNYVHPTGDGNLHVPATGTANSGKFLKAKSNTAGDIGWETIGIADVTNLSTTLNGKESTITAGNGIDKSGSTLSVKLDTNPGLSVASSGLKVGLTTNSGLETTSTGLQVDLSTSTTDDTTTSSGLKIISGANSGIALNMAAVRDRGNGSTAYGVFSNTQGFFTLASGNYSHAEGYDTISSSGSVIAISAFDNAVGIKELRFQDIGGIDIVADETLMIKFTSSSGKSPIFVKSNINTITQSTSSPPYAFLYYYIRIKNTDNTTFTDTIDASWEKIVRINSSSIYPSHSEGFKTIASGNASHAEGYETIASGSSSHAEGRNTEAKGAYAHAEGDSNSASGNSSHCEGYSSIASGDFSHAEGNNTEAQGQGSHAEGTSSWAVGSNSHAEGFNTKAEGNNSHSEGNSTIALQQNSHAEGLETISGSVNCHTEGYRTLATIGQYFEAKSTLSASTSSENDIGKSIISFSAYTISNKSFYYYTSGDDVSNNKFADNDTIYITLKNGLSPSSNNNKIIRAKVLSTTIGTYNSPNSSTEGYYRRTVEFVFDNESDTLTPNDVDWLIQEGIATNITNSHAEGRGTAAVGTESHAEGEGCVANGPNSHSEGYYTQASGTNSHAEGHKSIASGDDAHAEGEGTLASGPNSHAEGYETQATNNQAHAEGASTKATGISAHAEGTWTEANGDYSHAGGYYSYAKANSSFVHGYDLSTDTSTFGQFVIGKNNVTTSVALNNNAFIVGGGTIGGTSDNVFKIAYSGNFSYDGSGSTGAADYAEMFEWSDGNLENEDRVGYFTTIDGESEKIRIANEQDDYILGIVSAKPAIIADSGELRWQNKFLTDEWGREMYEEREIEIDGKIIKETVRKLNPEFDDSVDYIPRIKRPEWSPIGMLGKLSVKDDGTCQVGGYCKPNEDGIATQSTTGYRVIKRISENIVRVIFR